MASDDPVYLVKFPSAPRGTCCAIVYINGDKKNGLSRSTVGIAGAGLMGIGIATRFAVAGHRAILYDASPEQLDRVLQHVDAIVGELLASGSISTEQARAVPSRVSLCHVVHELHEASIVFEAIREDVQAKRRFFTELETVLSEGAVIASNTSGLLPDALSAEMRNPERFAIAHFWNPPHVISLVEIVPGTRTSGQTTRTLAESLGGIGMEPVGSKEPSPASSGIDCSSRFFARHFISFGLGWQSQPSSTR